MKRFVGLAGLLFLLLIPDFSWARGGGGCLEEGTLVRTPRGLMAIEKLAVGDRVWSVAEGRLKEARVQAVIQVHPEEFLEISAGGARLRITPEHPVMTAPGEYRRPAACSRVKRFSWSGKESRRRFRFNSYGVSLPGARPIISWSARAGLLLPGTLFCTTRAVFCPTARS